MVRYIELEPPQSNKFSSQRGPIFLLPNFLRTGPGSFGAPSHSLRPPLGSLAGGGYRDLVASRGNKVFPFISLCCWWQKGRGLPESYSGVTNCFNKWQSNAEGAQRGDHVNHRVQCLHHLLSLDCQVLCYLPEKLLEHSAVLQGTGRQHSGHRLIRRR